MVWGGDPPEAERRALQSSANLHTGKIQKVVLMGRAKKLSTVTDDGNRLEQLKNLAKILANQIDICSKNVTEGPKLMPQLSKQYRETIREIEEIEGVDKDDDEIGEILSERKADGKPNAVR